MNASTRLHIFVIENISNFSDFESDQNCNPDDLWNVCVMFELLPENVGSHKNTNDVTRICIGFAYLLLAALMRVRNSHIHVKMLRE